MDRNNQPQPNQPQSGQGQNQPNQPQQPILQSPILSPTHFDAQAQPANPAAGQQQPKMKNPADTAKNLMIVSIILGVVAVVGIALGIWGLSDSMSTHNELDKTTEELNAADKIVKKIEDETGETIKTADDVPEYQPVSGYIYISEWGIKIKMPEDLHEVSYILDQKYRPQICFNGLETSVTNVFPTFADIDRNPGGMGCLTRVETSEGNSDDSGYSFGELAYTDGKYNYFYEAPKKTFATSASEQGLEKTAVQLIKNMLTTGVSSYK